jgi:hypothetical protein
MKPAILIECGPESFCLRRTDGQEAIGAYLSRQSALQAAERRGWHVVSTEKPGPTPGIYGRRGKTASQ